MSALSHQAFQSQIAQSATEAWEMEFLQSGQSFSELLREVNAEKNNAVLVALSSIYDGLFNATERMHIVHASISGNCWHLSASTAQSSRDTPMAGASMSGGEKKKIDQNTPAFLRGLSQIFNELLEGMPLVNPDNRSVLSKYFVEDAHYYAERGLAPFLETLSEANILKEVESYVMDKRLMAQLIVLPLSKPRVVI